MGPGQVNTKKGHSRSSSSRNSLPPRRSPRNVTYSLPSDELVSDTDSESSEDEAKNDGDIIAALAKISGEAESEESPGLFEIDKSRLQLPGDIVTTKNIELSQEVLSSTIEKVTNEISKVHQRDVELIQKLIQQQNESRKFLEKSHQALLELLSKQTDSHSS